jgi:hypothetical protein
MKSSHKTFFTFAILFVLIVFFTADVHAQCAMCQATAESSRDAGSSNSEGINKGVMYLFFTPYLIIGTIAYFWWRARKKAQMEEMENQ